MQTLIDGLETASGNAVTQISSLWNSKVPYTGASAAVNLTTYGLTAGSLSAQGVTGTTVSATLLLAGNFMTSTATLAAGTATLASAVSALQTRATGLETGTGNLNTVQANYAVLTGSNIFTNAKSLSANGITGGAISGVTVSGGSFTTIGGVSAGTVSATTAIFASVTVSGSYRSAILNSGVTALATHTVNWAGSNVQKIILTGNSTFTFLGGQAGGRYMLMTQQGSPVSLTGKVTWPTTSTVIWAGGTSGAPTATSSAVDIFAFVYDGVKYHGTASNNFY